MGMGECGDTGVRTAPIEGDRGDLTGVRNPTTTVGEPGTGGFRGLLAGNEAAAAATATDALGCCCDMLDKERAGGIKALNALARCGEVAKLKKEFGTTGLSATGREAVV